MTYVCTRHTEYLLQEERLDFMKNLHKSDVRTVGLQLKLTALCLSWPFNPLADRIKEMGISQSASLLAYDFIELYGGVYHRLTPVMQVDFEQRLSRLAANQWSQFSSALGGSRHESSDTALKTTASLRGYAPSRPRLPTPMRTARAPDIKPQKRDTRPPTAPNTKYLSRPAMNSNLQGGSVSRRTGSRSMSTPSLSTSSVYERSTLVRDSFRPTTQTSQLRRTPTARRHFRSDLWF